MKEPMGHSAFPSDETLAAFIDGRLDEEMRKKVVAHVADCEECYDTVMAAGAWKLEGEPAAVVRHPSSRFVRWMATPAVAVAAIAALVVLLVPGVREPVEHLIAAHRTGMSALVNAANDIPYRPFEARLSGGFAYKRTQPLMRSGAGSEDDASKYKIYSVAGEMSRRLSKENTPENLHAFGVAQVFLGKTRDGQRLLIKSIETSTDEPSIFSAIRKCTDTQLLVDLSAAFLATNQKPTNDDLLIALEAADRAFRLRRSPEAGWNRALAIERLGLMARALAAWDDYLRIDPRSMWSDEVRGRIRALHALQNSRPTVDLDVLIQSFDTQLTTLSTGTSLSKLREIAHHVVDASSDYLFSDTVANIELRRDRRLTEDMFAALRAFAIGKSDFAAGKLNDARDDFAKADQLFARVDNPFALVAAYQGVRVTCTQGADSCDAQINDIERRLESSRSRYPSLRAKLLLVKGRRLLQLQRSFEALHVYEESLSEFERLHNVSDIAWAHSLIADVMSASGETDAALSHYLLALRTLAPPTSRRRQEFEEATIFLLKRDALSAARVLIEDIHDIPGDAVDVAGELTLRGLVRLRSGEIDGAMSDFSRVRRTLSSVPAEAAGWIPSILSIAQIAVRRTGLPGKRHIEIEQDAAKHDALWLSQLLFERGRLREEEGKLGEAENDYRGAIALLEERGARLDTMVLGAGLMPDSESPFDALIRLLVRTRQTEAALRICERAKGMDVSTLYGYADALPNVYRTDRPLTTAAKAAMGIAGATIFEYYALPDELLRWTIANGRVTLHRLPLRRERAIALFRDLSECARASCDASDVIKTASHTMLRPWPSSAVPQSTLIFVMPAAFGAVPLGTLQHDDGSTLAARNPLVFATTLTSLMDALDRDSERRAGSPSALFVAASRPPEPYAYLPAAERAASTSMLYPERCVLVGPDATRSRFLAITNTYSIVEFSGHALIDDLQPLRSALVFSQSSSGRGSDLLYVHDLSSVALKRVRLVVLNACGTGDAPRPSVSIANALRAQRVPSIIYTLWPVDDETAARFSAEFHRSLRAGHSRAVAIQSAALALRAAGSPHWAAFQLEGAFGII